MDEFSLLFARCSPSTYCSLHKRVSSISGDSRTLRKENRGCFMELFIHGCGQSTRSVCSKQLKMVFSLKPLLVICWKEVWSQLKKSRGRKGLKLIRTLVLHALNQIHSKQRSSRPLFTKSSCKI